MSLLRKTLMSTAVAAALAFGMTTQASAAPGVYTVNPDGLGNGISGYTPFQADHASGTSSVLITNLGGGDSSGSGWINFTAFSLAGTPYTAFDSGLQLGGANSYQIYATFTETLHSSNPGGFGVPGQSGVLTSLDFTLWANPNMTAGNRTTFTQANAPSSTGATVTQNGVNFILGTGHLISGTAGLDALGGAFFNSLTNFALTAAGSAFFTDPDPFFNLAFEEFNNTSQGILQNGNLVSITQETGSVDFNRTPEPASMALVGLGLVGLGVMRRRKVEA